MNIYTFGALLTLRIQYEYTQTQCEEGASDVNFHLRIPIIIRDLENIILNQALFLRIRPVVEK